MGTNVTFAAVAVASAALVGWVPVQQWRGRWPRGHPDALTSRVYLVFPFSVGLLLVALGALVEPVSRALSLLVFAAGLLSSAVGIVLGLWQPEAIRPGWQRAQKAALEQPPPRETSTDQSRD